MSSQLSPLPPLSPSIAPGTDSYSSPKPSGRHRRHSSIEHEIKHFRDLLLIERKRADEAEARAQETLSHLKAVNEARVKALHEAAQATEDLKLYKIQLENAQREIYRAQDVLKAVDRQRLDAEKEAADLRSKNRKLVEEARLQHAREQGRVQGMKEGLEKGRDLGLLEGRMMGYTSPAPTPPDHRYANQGETPSSHNSDLSSLTDYRPQRSRTGQPAPSRTNSVVSSITSRRSVGGRAEIPVPVPPPAPVSRRSSAQHLRSSSQSADHTRENTRPISVRNGPVSPSQPAFIPPDNYIPSIDADNVIRLPPPHEFQRPSSRTGPPPSPQHEPEIDERHHRRSAGTPHRRSRRHSSSESDSTTISQLDIVNDPERNLGMRTPMSAIAEVSSSQASPDPQLPRGEPDLRRQPSFTGSMRSQRSTTTTSAPLNDSRDLRVPFYTRPRTTSGSTVSTMPPHEVQHQPSQSTLGSAPPISVHPPSSPSSTGTTRSRSHQMSTPARGQLSPLPAEPPNIPSSSPPPEQAEYPSPIVLDSNQLPLNFVVTGYTPATTYAQLQPVNEEANTSGDGPPVIPDSALFGTDSSEDSEGASSMDTLTTPPTKQRPLDQQHQRGTSIAGSHYSASQAPGTPRWGDSTAGGAAQVSLTPSVAPGTQRSTWGVAGAPLPPSSVAGTPWTGSSTVGPENVPLPPSTVASSTPRRGGTSIGKASSTKSRSGSRNTKRSVS